jgi:2-phosphosulfolactate phosphatase
VVVVIDVLRAFSTAAYAFGRGAERILPVSTVEEALQYKQRHPGVLAIGEVHGLPPPGFDMGNSPTRLVEHDLSGCTVVQRTTAGTQGVIRSRNASTLLTASFVVAGATVRYIEGIKPESVTFVATGQGHERGAEDLACAEYLEACLRGQKPDHEPYLERVRNCHDAKILYDPNEPDFPESDMMYCIDIDRFSFAMRVQEENGELTMRAVNI